jgi:3-oxoadipate enol-lactonase
MGGMIAQELAMRHPQLVRGLVLMGTRPPAPAHIAPTRSISERILLGRSSADSAEDFINGMWTSFCAPGFGDRHPDLIDELVGQATQRNTPRVAITAQMRAIAAWHGADRLRRLRCPTVVVHGDADHLMPIGNGMRIAQLIDHARYIELPGVGHIVPMEATDQLAAIITDAG